MKGLKQHARKRVERVRKWFARDDRESLERRYALGRDVEALYMDRTANGTNKHGHRFIATLCVAFGWDQGVVYGAMAFTNAFSRMEIAAPRKRPMPNGRLIPGGHLLTLARAKLQKEVRAVFIGKAIAGGWTHSELLQALPKDTTGKVVKDERGRPLKIPKNMDSLVAQQKAHAEQFVNRAEKVPNVTKTSNTHFARFREGLPNRL